MKINIIKGSFSGCLLIAFIVIVYSGFGATNIVGGKELFRQQLPNKGEKVLGVVKKCVHLGGTGNNIRIAIVPWRFDGNKPADVTKFNQLANKIAQGYLNTEPYASNVDRFSVSRADDYSGQFVSRNNVWYNPILIKAASICNYNQIIVIEHNGGWAGGAPGYFSVVGSGTPSTCDPKTCTGIGCPWTNTCSWDENIQYTALHETGHTFAGLRHLCYPLSKEDNLLNKLEMISLGSDNVDDPINCGVNYSGSQSKPCREWSNSKFINWKLMGDPNFGCYTGCDDRPNWYRPWYSTQTIMCMDLYLDKGFTPVDRKMLADLLGDSCPEITDWRGEYWNNNNLSGTVALCRNDPKIDFLWEDGSPDPHIFADNFSARWTRKMTFSNGVYSIKILHDDGARLFFDGVAVYNNWCKNCSITTNITQYIASGLHDIKYEMHEINGSAKASLFFVKVTPQQPANVDASNGLYISKVLIKWNTVEFANEYEVYRSTTVLGSKTLLGRTSGIKYDDTNAIEGRKYYYWAKACNYSKCSGFSEPDIGWR